MSNQTQSLNYTNTLQKLIEGNENYVRSTTLSTNVSQSVREHVCVNGQHPYAVVITCSDSRVIPENIFSAGIGELFIIRVAGNVIDDAVLGSVDYAVNHLGVNLVVVLGHTHCGAITSAISGGVTGAVKNITDKICNAIENEKDVSLASIKNVRYSVTLLENIFSINSPNVKIVGAIYHTEKGNVDFLQ